MLNGSYMISAAGVLATTAAESGVYLHDEHEHAERMIAVSGQESPARVCTRSLSPYKTSA